MCLKKFSDFIFFPIKINTLWENFFGQEVTPAFLHTRENLCAGKLRQFPAVTPRVPKNTFEFTSY